LGSNISLPSSRYQINNTTQNSTGPVFNSFSILPIEGDTETMYVFSASATGQNGSAIHSIFVYIDNKGPYGLSKDNSTTNFILEKRLEKGRHSVYFVGVDKNGVKTDTHLSPINVTVSQHQEVGGTSYTRYICIGIIAVVTILVMVLTYRYYKKAKEQMKKQMERPPRSKIICSKCSKMVDDDLEKCPHCGAKFTGEEYYCPFCKTLIPEGATKCPFCKKTFTKKEPNGTGKEKMACPKCGAVVGINERICPGCDHDFSKGRKLKTKTGRSGEHKGDVYMCSLCGADVKESEGRCPKCGAKFS
jgi:RNA polymerase subunit RPABC4/transcription elongation factor Spt4